GGLLTVEATGRRRHYRLADPGVATLIEALERLAPSLPIKSFDQSQQVHGWAVLEALGITVGPSRQPVRIHADSTEEGEHLSGALGRALLCGFEDLGWVRRQKEQRL